MSWESSASRTPVPLPLPQNLDGGGGFDLTPASSRKGSMAQEAGAAAGGVADGVGIGEEDVPDVRFLLLTIAPNRQWLICEITFDQREKIFIDYLQKTKKFPGEELQIAFEVSESMNRQRRFIVRLNERAAGLFVRMLRKRRHLLFLKMMLKTYGGCTSVKSYIPHRYQDAGQLQGDIKALQEQLESLTAQVLVLIKRVKDLKGQAVQMPEVLKKPLDLPKAEAK